MCLILLSLTSNNFSIPHYYCTSADDHYYPKLLNLIGSIHAADYENLAEIAVFDLGFTELQKANLNQMAKVKLYQVELVHPDLLTHFITSPAGREVRGWYAWKPVVIKQALELFPYILYIDAGAVVLRPLDNLFKHIVQQGYFFMTCGPHTIADTLTTSIRTKILPKLTAVERAKILAPDSFNIGSGLQGLTRQLYTNYVLPVSRYSQDLSLFADDGSALHGFGSARHDQTLFGMYVYLNNLTINSDGVSHLTVDGEDRQIHIHWHPECVSERYTSIFQCRSRAGKYSNLYKLIKYKN